MPNVCLPFPNTHSSEQSISVPADSKPTEKRLSAARYLSYTKTYVVRETSPLVQDNLLSVLIPVAAPPAMPVHLKTLEMA